MAVTTDSVFAGADAGTGVAADHGKPLPDQAPDLLAALFDPANRPNPYPLYARLRAAGRLHETPFGLRVATRHDDCVAVLSNQSWGHDQEAHQLHPTLPAEEFPATFLWMEPPDHTRLRGLVSKAFTPGRVADLRPRITALVDDLLDTALRAGEFDLIETIAYPLPLTIICEILGVPAADHGIIQIWSQALARAFDPDVLMSPEALAERNDAIPEFLAYFRALVARSRRSGGDDLLSALAAVEEQGDRLTEDELLGTCVTLLIAGHETTVNLVGNGALALLRNPDQTALLRDEPDLIRPAVDELLRYDSPIHLNTRAATREMTVGGRTFSPGEGVVALIACANRDPEAFDDPDRLDVRRYVAGSGASRHLSFSLGHHYCLGAPLALLEMEIFLAGFLHRVRSAELLVDSPPYKSNLLIRGLAELPVRFRG
ncbi:cytochrome P450 [Frankia casuarinae]|uniref:Cytochrome P450 n=1 Tax=Frankia casuarinae (strain DSM 45818 / CECT 9043 / HFP020203 / CcI3) TaxID=106370 RepID=Q2JBN7_FRACC|nr:MULTISPECIES: cytochrome P450 [Frankia]ABD11305.1 cytochrome P450 [Frankia casuarinae]ETA00627.1 cytochrome P450 [Frankia sp. CcI6]EYT90767.1 cytochrome P450 [Frankia casuarinae]KDA41583.1 cytochrome P450 [Frankia sp. BMG5.23]KEZ35075.1 cytochrome P450 [Frankia sp. CeD]